MTTTLPESADLPADLNLVRIMRVGEPEYYSGGLTLTQATYGPSWNSPGEAVKHLVEGAYYCDLWFDDPNRSDYTNKGAQTTDVECELHDPDDGTCSYILVRIVQL